MKMRYFLLVFFVVFFFACGHVEEKRVVDLESKMYLLLENRRVKDTVYRYFVSLDDRDWESVKACFADEVFVDMTSMGGGEPGNLTPQQIVEAFEQGLRGLETLHHQVGIYNVSLKGNEADVFCNGIATHYLPNVTGQNSRMFVGSYNLHLKKIGEDWKIDRFRFNLKYVDGNVDLQEYVE